MKYGYYRISRQEHSIIFDSVSRMSRNAYEGIETYFELYEKGISLVFLKEHYNDTAVYEENMKDRIELHGTDEDEIFKGLNNYFLLDDLRSLVLSEQVGICPDRFR